MPYTFSHRIEVRFRDCDPMAHANNAVYFTYLEQTRFACWRELFGFESPEQAGIILARAECDFRAPARAGDILEVRMRVSSVGRTSFGYEYEIVNAASAVVVATGKSVQVMYDYKVGRPIPIPADLREKLEQMAVSRAERRAEL